MELENALIQSADRQADRPVESDYDNILLTEW